MPWLGCSSPWLPVVQKGQERRERGAITIYIRRGRGCQELYLKNSCEQVESLWISLRKQRKTSWWVPAAVLLIQGSLFKVLAPATGGITDPSPTVGLHLPLQRDSIYPCRCWKSSNVSCRQSRRLREFIEDNFYSR